MFSFRKDKVGFFTTLLVVPLLVGLGVVPLALFIIGLALGKLDDFSLPIKIFFGVCWPLLVVTVLIRVWIFRVQMINKRKREGQEQSADTQSEEQS
ncbi:MAG: hypothetical protein ACKO9Z_02200 [Planctomycetota bacterium]|nr:hypothetical protein [Planctomycetota bacterium]